MNPNKLDKRTVKYLTVCKSPKAFREVMRATPDSTVKFICNAAYNVQRNPNIVLTPEEKKLFATNRALISTLTDKTVPIALKRKRLVQRGGVFLPRLLLTALPALDALKRVSDVGSSNVKEQIGNGNEAVQMLEYLHDLCAHPDEFRDFVRDAPDSVVELICHVAHNVKNNKSIALPPYVQALLTKDNKEITMLANPKVSIGEKRAKLTSQTGGIFPFLAPLLGAIIPAIKGAAAVAIPAIIKGASIAAPVIAKGAALAKAAVLPALKSVAYGSLGASIPEVAKTIVAAVKKPEDAIVRVVHEQAKQEEAAAPTGVVAQTGKGKKRTKKVKLI
jgi:hypothetical protein